jgi:aryl-alcohol dehydrogenase-like predicted oxidoreductase
MEYRRLGNTGLNVSPLCLGTMMLGGWGNRDEDECIRMIHTALDAGINFIDTANVYSQGGSETIVGKALVGRREDVVLATKVWGRMGKGPNDQGLSRKHIRRQVEDSLRRLQTDYIDLYQIHRVDPNTPIEETLSTLHDLVREGKVRYLGCSTSDSLPGGGSAPEIPLSAWQMVDWFWIARTNGWEPFVCLQPPHSMLRREVERGLFPASVAHGMGIIPWSPLDGGWLTGKYRKGQPIPEDSRGGRMRRDPFDPEAPRNARKAEVVQELCGMASEAGIPLSRLALAWSMAQPGVTAPIIGPRTPAQLEDNLQAIEVKVPQQIIEAVDRLVPPGTNV